VVTAATEGRTPDRALREGQTMKRFVHFAIQSIRPFSPCLVQIFQKKVSLRRASMLDPAKGSVTELDAAWTRFKPTSQYIEHQEDICKQGVPTVFFQASCLRRFGPEPRLDGPGKEERSWGGLGHAFPPNDRWPQALYAAKLILAWSR
jgi:hypothetical protein